MPPCERCGSANSAGIPHSFAKEPCSGIPRPAPQLSHEAYHDLCRHDAVLFSRLDYIGPQHVTTAEHGAPRVLLLANCNLPDCHSTLCRWVAVGSPEQLKYAAMDAERKAA